MLQAVSLCELYYRSRCPTEMLPVIERMMISIPFPSRNYSLPVPVSVVAITSRDPETMERV